MNHRIHIGAINPSIDGGSYPVKRVVSDELTVSADILRDSHNLVRSQVRWREGSRPTSEWQLVSMTHKSNDRWQATLLLTRCADRGYLAITLAKLQAANTLLAALQAVEDPGLEDVVDHWTPRPDIVTLAMLQVKVDQQRAVFGNWPDGSIKHAENPPKKYEDICALKFDTPDPEDLWQAFLDVVTIWMKHRVKIFRVDNPHTKPFPFWSWLIAKVHENHPEVIFLSEAFTSPKVMKHLAKLGFTQSYTYFTWCNSATELRDYLQELCYSGMQEYFRPNFFTNTPDILPKILQTGGAPAFKMRLVLAATLSPNYGIYSGFEICENTAVPNSEEYLNSEKYEIRVRDWNQAGNVCDLITRINQIRSENVAFQRLDNIQFFKSDNDNLLFYGKSLGDNVLLIVVNLDPHNPHQGLVSIPAEFVGVPPGGRYSVLDLLTDAEYCWGECNYVRLDPHVQVAHILKIHHLT